MTNEKDLQDRCDKMSFILGFVYSVIHSMTEESGDIDIKNKVIELDSWFEEKLTDLFYKDDSQ